MRVTARYRRYAFRAVMTDRQYRNDPPDLFARQHRRHPRHPPAAQQFKLPEVVARDSILQDVVIEEDQGVERLVLARRAEPPARDQFVEKRLDVWRRQLRR